MDIGKLNRWIRIESQPTGQDANYGTPTGSWTTFCTDWANMQDVLPSKGESQADGIRIAERPTRIRMRYRTGITSDMRVVLLDRDNRALKILTSPVEIGGSQRGIEFMAADYSTSGDAA